MYALIRRNRQPTAVRHLVSALHRQAPSGLGQAAGSSLPSHHIFCAGSYTPIFARLAAESVLASCPAGLRSELRLFIHVDGVAARARPALLEWLREIPGVEVTYGLFGILSRDRIPGKWHQVMINDIVRLFRSEPHLAFVDADLFLAADAWWQLCQHNLSDDLFALSAGLRQNRQLLLGGARYCPIKTNLFTLNTRAYLDLNLQRFNKDERALVLLRQEYPQGRLDAPNIDTLIAASLRAQAHGLRVEDVDGRVDYCHVGGFSHLRVNKFQGYEAPENRATIEAWLARLRLLSRVLELFLARGWGAFVDQEYRRNVEQARILVRDNPVLGRMLDQVPPTRHEQVFEQLFGAEAHA